jgi:hypothetical protein
MNCVHVSAAKAAVQCFYTLHKEAALAVCVIAVEQAITWKAAACRRENLLRPVATTARALDSASISALQHGLESKPDNVAHKLTACCVTGLTRRVVVESDDSQLNNKKKAS